MNSRQTTKALYCAFRMCSTQEDGTHGPAERCARKGCKGGPFNREPMCETFRRDPTIAEEKTFSLIEFSGIRAFRQTKAHRFIYKDSWDNPANAVLKTAKG